MNNYLHSCCCDNAAHIRDHCFAKDIVNQTVVPHEPEPIDNCCVQTISLPGMGNMLHTEPIIWIFFVLRRLDVNSTLSILSTPTVDRLYIEFRRIFVYTDEAN